MEPMTRTWRHYRQGMPPIRNLAKHGRSMALIGLAGTAAVFLAGCEAQGVVIQQPLQLLVTHTETGEPVPDAVITSISSSLASILEREHGLTLCEAYDTPNASTYETDEQGEVTFPLGLSIACFDCSNIEPEQVAGENENFLWRIQSNDVEETLEVTMAADAVSVGEFFTVAVLSVAEPTVGPKGPLHAD